VLCPICRVKRTRCRTELLAQRPAADILHNNAAATVLAATKDLPVSAADPGVWDETMRVNLRGALVAIQAAVPHMMARGGGSVINTASGAGLTGDLRPPAYGASKAALVSLTRYAAAEFGKQGIRCNAISPGFIVIAGKPGREAVHATMLRHALTPRLGQPEDIAALCPSRGKVAACRSCRHLAGADRRRHWPVMIRATQTESRTGTQLKPGDHAS
jgi:NAD(P)-dependent dehydrogenase (short-subunit alcohol dehydrogenase family)